MNRNRLLVIGAVALLLATFVSYSIYKVLRVAVNTHQANATVAVVAAAADLPIGARLEEKDLQLVQMPEKYLPPGSHSSTSELVGRGVIVPMTKSELVLDSKLAEANAGAGLPSLIPDGMRAVSVKVNDVISVAGFVTAGTHVDVVLTGSPEKDNDPAKVTTTTVLENVQVLAAGQKLQKNEQGEAQQVTVITLLVKPEDAQKLVLASSEGRIQLALRNPLDTKDESIPMIRHAALYRLQPGGVPEPSKPSPMRHFAKTAPAPPPPPPAPYIVEMIRGEKRDLAKF